MDLMLPGMLGEAARRRLNAILSAIPAAAQQIFDSRASAVSAQISAATDAVYCGGYAAAGDGGQGLWIRGGTGALPGFLSNSGTVGWTYVPEPGGYNSKVWGIGLGGSDDGPGLNTLFRFFSSDGGRTLNKSAAILFSGVHNIQTPVIVPGGSSNALLLKGRTPRARGAGQGTTFSWTGAAATSMFIGYGCNELVVEDIAFSGVGGSSVTNCFHIAADNVVNTTTTATITAGAGVSVSVAASTNIIAGQLLGIDTGANFEVVYVTSISGGNLVATFTKNHASGIVVGGGTGSSGVTFRDCGFFVSGAANASGDLWGNLTASSTPQVSEGKTERCYYTGLSPAGTSYAGHRIVAGGNVKNFSFNRDSFTNFQKNIALDAGSGSILVLFPISAHATVADVGAAGGFDLTIIGAQSEQNTGAFMVGTSGSFAQNVTAIGCVWTGTPSDDYAINLGASLTLTGNQFNNIRTGSSVPKVKCGNVSGATSASLSAGSINSTGNYYHQAVVASDVFDDGSGNPFMDATATFAVGQASPRLTSLGDYGAVPFPYRMGHLQLNTGLMVTSATAAGIAFGSQGKVVGTKSTFVIPFTALQAAALTSDVVVGSIPAKTKVRAVYADVTTAFSGTAGTLLGRLGITVGGQELLLDFNTAATGQFGLADADLGTSLQRANAVQGGYIPSWSASTTIRYRETSSSGNLSGLTQGSVTITLVLEREDA